MRLFKIIRSTPGFLLTLICSVFIFTTAVVYAVDDDGLHQIGLDEDMTADGSDVNRANILGRRSGLGAVGVPDWEDLFNADGSLRDDLDGALSASPNGIADVVDYGGITASFVQDDVSAGNAIDRTTFVSKGSDKNSDPPSTLRWGSDSVPAKNDVGNAYVQAVLDNGHLIIYAGVERVEEDGANHVDFEFNQADIGTDSDGDGIADGGLECQDGADCFLVGERTDGDLLVSMDFGRGGVFGELTFRRWEGTDAAGDWSAPIASLEGEGCNGANGIPEDVVCGFNNNGTIDGGPWDNFDRTGAVVANLPQNALTEVGFDVTALLDAVPCFSTVQVKTRSSPSFSSELKDFTLAGFSICGIAASKTCDAAINEAGDEVTIKSSGTVSNTGALDLGIRLSDLALDANSNEDPLPPLGVDADITQICFVDTATGIGEGNPCNDADPAPTVTYTDGVAEFVLTAGVSVYYESEYTIDASSGLTSLDFADEVLAEAFEIDEFGEFDPALQDAVAQATAPADCMAVGTPDIAITKVCNNDDPNFGVNAAGNMFTGTFNGTAENTGNVKLVNVQVSDPTLSSLAVFYDDGLVAGEVDGNDTPFTNGDDLEPGETLVWEGSLTIDNGTSIDNTIFIEGTNVFDAAEDVTANANALCEAAPIPRLSLTKVCDTSIGGGTGVELVTTPDNNGNIIVAVQVGNIISVAAADGGLNSEVAMDVTVSDDQVATLIQTGGSTATTFSCTAKTLSDPATCTGVLAPGETVEFTQTYKPDGTSITGSLGLPGGITFNNTATASGLGALNAGDIEGLEASAMCELCP